MSCGSARSPAISSMARSSRQRHSQVPRKTTVSRQPRKVRFGELFEEIFSVANDPEVVPLGAAVPADRV